MTATIPVGPFALTRLIGVGGMGEVWEGAHVGQGVPVAVKVITAARARDPRYREAFRNEVRSVAGLDHPGIVHVFDYGEVDLRAEEASLGRLVAGSPFLAMELADGGSLRTRPHPHTWRQLSGTLLALLDVLAHAHARGVIHRDMKPGNVLVFGGHESDADAVPEPHQLRLSDFGLAHATDSGEGAVRGTSGTPTYMAPEQFLGQWRDFGPWTDLYAVGCMAFSFAHGSPPFQGGGLIGLRQAHLSADPPALTPVVPVPDGFESWLLRLMDKDPLARFQTAADAAYALLLLGDARDDAPPADLPIDNVQVLPSRFTLDMSLAEWETTHVTQKGDAPTTLPPDQDDEMPIGAGGQHLMRRRLPPLPASWRNLDPPRRSMRLVGAGLGLYGLRAIPMVGRMSARDGLWQALYQALQEQAPRLCLVRGAAGAGKTRLARWLAERASEVGNAVVLVAEHSQGGGPRDGLGRMVQRALGCVGQPRVEMLRRAERWFRRRGVVDSNEWVGAVEMVWPTPEEELAHQSGEQRFFGPSERYALVHRLMTHLAGGLDDRVGGGPVLRPIVLLLDDLQWGADAVGLARHLLSIEPGVGPPVLVVATVRDEAIAGSGDVTRLLQSQRSSEIMLGPLTGEDSHALVRELLGLEVDLARQVEQRAAGNPLFAVQLVGDWVQRGVLEVSSQGFSLRPGEQAVLPDDIHALWAERVSQIASIYGEDARFGLETAALLGNQVDDAEWRGACSVARLSLPSNLVQELVERRLATEEPSGWAFAHGMLRESLIRAAEEAGHAKRLHDACATTLSIRFAVARQPGLAERLARHLLGADRAAEALRPLQEAARERRLLSAYSDAFDLLDTHDAALRTVASQTNDMRWGATWLDRAEVLLASGNLTDADERARRVVATGREMGWDVLVARALLLQGTVSLKLGRLAEAEERLKEAERSARRAGEERTIAKCHLVLSDLFRTRGAARDANHHAREAYRRFAAASDGRGLADALLAQAVANRALGDLVRTEQFTRQAIPHYERVGSRFGVATCENVLGEVARANGDLAGANRAYAEAESLLRLVGSAEHLVPQINRALVLIAEGNDAAARSVLVGALYTAKQQGRAGITGALHAFLLPICARARDWSGWRTHALEADKLLRETGYVDPDVAQAAETGAQVAASLGYTQQALLAWQLALAQFAALGNRDGAHRVRRAVEALTSRTRG
jgi:serine/threonine protein kinase/tetratricopeptide (TPR) repeat protein